MPLGVDFANTIDHLAEQILAFLLRTQTLAVRLEERALDHTLVMTTQGAHMVRRALLFLTLAVFFLSPTFAQRQICTLEGECVTHSSGPDFGSDPHHPIPPGFGSGPTFALWDQEPYRNADMGPLGVVLSTGEFQITVTDLEIPGRGMSFRLSRTYRSRRDGEKSLLGNNWYLNYDEYITPGTYWDQAHGQNCLALEWTMGNGFTNVWIDQCTNGTAWKPFMGFFGKLRVLSGTHPTYQIRYPDGTVKTFAQWAQNGALQDMYLLTRIEDRNGNAITMQHSGRGISTITDTLGRKITFHYNEPNYPWRISSVSDFTSGPRTVSYTYDNLKGDLISVQSPLAHASTGGIDTSIQSTTYYEYWSPPGCADGMFLHNLQTIKDTSSNVILENTYYARSNTTCGVEGPNDTIATQHYGGGQISYAYSSLGPAQYISANASNAQAVVTDQLGNRQTHQFNTEGNPLSIVYETNRGIRAGEGDYTETFGYVDHGTDDHPMLVSTHTKSGGSNVDSTGNIASYTYGETEATEYYNQDGSETNPDIFQKGNVTKVQRIAGVGSGLRPVPAGQATLETKYEYEPLFNQPIKITDPSLHVTSIIYDYQEGLIADLTSNNPPISVSTVWWTNGEISSFLDPTKQNSNKGDINGDGYHRGGNPIRQYDGIARNAAGEPTSPGANDDIATYMAYNRFGLVVRTRDAEYNETSYDYFPENNPDGENPATPTPVDGRSLTTDPGGYLKETVLDATPTMPLPAGVSGTPREGGQNPGNQNVHLFYFYDPVGNLVRSRDGRGIETTYVVNELNQVVQIIHDSPVAPATSGTLAYQEQFQYDVNGNLVTHRTEQRDDVSQATGQNRWITDSMCYDSNNRKWRESISTADSPALTRASLYYYDSVGNLIATISPGGNVTRREYDERNLLYKQIAVNGCIETPPASGDCALGPPTLQCSSAIDSTDAVTTYDYDGSGNLIQVTDPGGHKSLTGYDGHDRKVVEFDPIYQKTSLSYDILGNVTEKILQGMTVRDDAPTPSSPPATAYPEIAHLRRYYDELGRLRRSDARFMKWDSAGNPISITTDGNAGLASAADSPAPAGDGYVTRLVSYDRLGRVTRLTDDNGHSTETRYDGLGRKVKVLMNVALPFVFDSSNPLNNRNAADLFYDPNGNVTQITETEYGADRTDVSHPPRLLQAQQYQSTFQYDAMNRQVESTLVGRSDHGQIALNLTTKTAYDSRGNKIQVTDPAGGRIKYSYDGLDHVVKTEGGYFWNGTAESVPSNMINTANPDGKVTTTYSYDLNGRLLSLVDDNNRATQYTYDNLSRPTRVTYADNSYRAVTYNRDSLATSWTHSGGGSALTASMVFDWLHRPKQIDIDNSLALGVLGTQHQFFQYDGFGRITSAIDSIDADNMSQVLLTYNSMGKVLTEQQLWWDKTTGTALSGSETVTSVYDGVGFRKSVAYPNDGRVVHYEPDELDRVELIWEDSPGPIFRYDYLGSSRILNRAYIKQTSPGTPGQKPTSFDSVTTVLTMLANASDTDVLVGYDNARRVKKFAQRLGSPDGLELSSFSYAYDSVGNRTSELRMHEPASSYWKGETYGYDATYRLINRKEGTLDSSGALLSSTTTQDFTLDALGNWKSHKKNSTTYNQAINYLNQYGVFNGANGQRTLSYDFLGNLSNETRPLGMTQFSYDFLNRMVEWQDEISGVRYYRYDALGRRISKNIGGNLVTHFVYDGNRLIQERDGTNAVVASYVYGLGADDVLTRRRVSGGSTTDIFYQSNALGSVTAVTSDTGSVLERYKYDAYGQVTFMDPGNTPIGSSTVYNNILFTGRYYDTETKLYYYRARMYHPYLGRFLQRDPLGVSEGPNLYNYVFNDPINSADPTGMESDRPRNYQIAIGQMMAATAAYSYSREYVSMSRVQHSSYFGDNLDGRFRNQRDAMEEAQLIARGAMEPPMRSGPFPWKPKVPEGASSASLSNADEPTEPPKTPEEWEKYCKEHPESCGHASVSGGEPRGFLDWLIGRNNGAAWVDAFQNPWVQTRWSGLVPQGVAQAIDHVHSMVPKNAWMNGMHAWHAGSNAYLAQEFGVLGAPIVFAGGLYHESPLDTGSYSVEQGQGNVNHFLDSYMDIEANYFGLVIGIFDPSGNAVEHAISWGNHIPGPGDPVMGGGEPYNGDPTTAWGQYP